MTWNGLKETESLFCDAPTVSIGSFMGQAEWIPSSAGKAPLVTLGLTDFAIEFVVRFRDGDPTIGADDLFYISGLIEDNSVAQELGDLKAGTAFLNSADFAGAILLFSYIGDGGTASTTVSWPAPQTAFVHVCGNFDRDGVLEMFVNGVSVDTADISFDSAFPIPEYGLHPLIAEEEGRIEWDSLSENPSVVHLLTCFMSGFALHSRLLTADEIAFNAATLNVGNYGAADTLARYDFDSIVDAVGDPVVVDKETTKTNISIGPKWTLPEPWNSELFGVKAADGDAFIGDSSGNDRNYGIVTAATYSDATLAERCIAAFGETGAL